jgi:hypothetical protein
MILIYFAVWICFKCPDLFYGGNITSWGYLLLAILISESSWRLLK